MDAMRRGSAAGFRAAMAPFEASALQLGALRV
jgi:hypothetical protein